MCCMHSLRTLYLVHGATHHGSHQHLQRVRHLRQTPSNKRPLEALRKAHAWDAVMSLHFYRSPLRALPIEWLPEDVKRSWSWDGSDIGPWSPATVYAFRLAIPENYVDQYSLEVVRS